MKSLQSWLNKRISDHIKKSAEINVQHRPISELLDQVEIEHGKDARDHLVKTLFRKLGDTTKIYLKHDKPEKSLLSYESYLTDPVFKKKALEESPSNFHRHLMDSEIKSAWKKVAKAIKNLSLKDLGKSKDLDKSESLTKTVEDKDWNRIKRSHSKDASLHVDHKEHLINNPAPADYKQIFTHPVDIESKSSGDITSGISAKMVHDTDFPNHDQNTYMSKPYHKKIESATKTWVKKPILGWATMATKALFNAGNIGHLAEDVSVHEHEGIPMTVHKFAEHHSDLTSPGQKPEVDPLEKQQIATMDYLTGNNDRHFGNLLVSDFGTPRGFHLIKAIDHERNFQYAKLLDRNPAAVTNYGLSQHESPYAHMKRSALGALKSPNIGHSELAQWWDEHGHNIRDKFNKQVEMIQDPETRQHTTDNFVHRWNHMNNWAKAALAGEIDDSSPNDFHNAFKGTRIIKPQSARITKKTIRDHLSQNKTDALSSLSDIINKKDKLSPEQWRTMKDTMDSIIKDMSPEEMTSFYRHAMENPHLNTEKMRKNPEINPKQVILRHIADPVEWQNNNPVYKTDHIKAMRDFVDQLPEGEKKDMLTYWRDHFNRLLEETNQGRAA